METKFFSFILLLLSLLLSEEVMQTHGRWCSSPSTSFKGVCIRKHPCEKACISEGFSKGKCVGSLNRHCKCFMECGTGGGGGGGGGGGDYPPYTPPSPFRDFPTEQSLITTEGVDEEAAMVGLEGKDQPDSSAKSPEESPHNHHEVSYNAPSPSAEPPEVTSAPKGEASEVKLDNYMLPPPFK